MYRKKEKKEKRERKRKNICLLFKYYDIFKEREKEKKKRERERERKKRKERERERERRFKKLNKLKICSFHPHLFRQVHAHVGDSTTVWSDCLSLWRNLRPIIKANLI